MARKKRNEILVGLFTFAGILLFLLLIFLMGSFDRLLERQAVVNAVFDDVQGLQVGDPVYLFGMKVGTVERIELLEKERQDEPVRLLVSTSIPERYRAFLRVNSRAHIDKSLTGSISVLIHESEDGTGAPLPAGSTLEGKGSRELAEIADQAGELLDEGRDAVRSVARVVRTIEERGELTKTIGNLAAVTEELKKKIDPLSRSVDDTLQSVKRLVVDNEKNIGETVSNLKETTALAKAFVDKLGSAPEQIKESVKVLTGAGRSVEALISENRTNVDLILDDLRKTMSNAETLTAEVKRRPWRLLYKPGVDEMKALELYDAAWAYNLGATELYRSVRVLADRLKRPPDEEDHQELVELALQQVRQSLEKQREAEEQFWKRLGEGD